jgi:hypothetical protein
MIEEGEGRIQNSRMCSGVAQRVVIGSSITHQTRSGPGAALTAPGPAETPKEVPT